MAEVNPSIAIYFFVAVFAAYYYYKYSKKNVVSNGVIFVFASILLVGEYFINVGMSKDICGYDQYMNAAFATFIPWLLIFGALKMALVVFPGGFGTLDEMSELLTLTQTQKLHKKLVTVFYGTSFWKEVINFDALVKHGMISESDLGLFQFADDVDSAYNILTQGLTDLYLGKEGQAPDIPHVVD